MLVEPAHLLNWLLTLVACFVSLQAIRFLVSLQPRMAMHLDCLA